MLSGKQFSSGDESISSPFSNIPHSNSIAQFINKTLATSAAFGGQQSASFVNGQQLTTGDSSDNPRITAPSSKQLAAIDAANNAAFIAAAAAAAAKSAAAAAVCIPHHQKSNSASGSLSSEPMSESSSSILRYPGGSNSNSGNGGSEADSERDSVSPQRVCDEVRNLSLFYNLYHRFVVLLDSILSMGLMG